MEYVIPIVLVMLLVAGFVTFLVMNATNKSGPVADRGDEGAPGIGSDPTPLGDTTEHAGEQTEGGTTRGDPERGAGGGTDPGSAEPVVRPGEGEGKERIEPERSEDRFEPERPASERLADRDF